MTATPRPKLCIICGGSFPTPADRDRHRETAHPGYRVGWGGRKNREPKIIAPDGSETIVAPADYQRMRRASLRAAGPAADFGAGPDTVPPEPGSPSGAPGEALPGPAPRPAPFVAQPALRVGTAITEATAREIVGRELTTEVLGELIRQLSAVVSDMDGAGDAGTFSPIQARQLAMLLHDSTLDLIVARFGGNVTRFKLGIAAVIIILGKGRVHMMAIAARIEERRALLTDGSDADEPAIEPEDAEPVTPPPPPPPPAVPVVPEPETAHSLPVPPVIANDLGPGVAGPR